MVEVLFGVSGLLIRDASYDDLPQILEIERLSFVQPWSLTSFRRELAVPFSRLIVATWDERLIAFMVRWLVADESHILNIAVLPQHRRSGVGGRLLEQAIDEARTHGVRLVTLEVRRTNLAARGLYRKF